MVATPPSGVARGWPRLGMVWAPGGAPQPLLPSSGKIGTSGYFPRIADLQKYGVLTVFFPAEF
jgi:hypothetical protein